MTDAATVGVLQDVFCLAILALCMALFVYAWLRRKTGQHWNYEGNVLVRPFDEGDAVVALMLLAFFGMALLRAPVHGAAEATDAANDPTRSIIQLVAGEAVFLGVCLSLLLYLRFFRGMNVAEMFGLRQLRPGAAALRALFWIIGVVLVMILVTYVLQNTIHGAMNDETPQESVQEFEGSSSLLFRVLLGASAIIVAPLTEEAIFRGFLYGVTKRFTDRWFAAIFTSVMFAVVHDHVGSFFPLAVLAFGLSVAYEVTGCLLVPVFMHAMFNAYNIAELIYG